MANSRMRILDMNISEFLSSFCIRSIEGQTKDNDSTFNSNRQPLVVCLGYWEAFVVHCDSVYLKQCSK